MATINANICIRRDTAANWTINNPTMLVGEIGYETDTGTPLDMRPMRRSRAPHLTGLTV